MTDEKKSGVTTAAGQGKAKADTDEKPKAAPKRKAEPKDKESRLDKAQKKVDDARKEVEKAALSDLADAADERAKDKSLDERQRDIIKADAKKIRKGAE